MRLLLVESDDKSCEALRAVLAKEGYQADCAASAEAALKLLEELSYDLIMADIMLPGMDGIELVKTIKEKDRSKVCILMTARATLDTTLKAIKCGASDYLLKPLMYDEVIQSVKHALMSRVHVESEQSSVATPGKNIDYAQIIGESDVIKNLVGEVRKIADSRSNVLLVGETGTGKELFARAIHSGSCRRNGPFIPINCSAVPETLLESEFFGYERGAFTGAAMPKKGLFEAADGGTLFLDEIGDLSQPLQAKLLRVMDDREIRPLGGIQTKKVDIRFLAATNRDIVKEVREGRFREDLYYRINVVTLKIMPLRDRKGDVPLLARAFVRRYSKELGKPVETIDDTTMKLLTEYEWPGNVRELQNIIERAVLLADGDVLLPFHLAEELRNSTPLSHINAAPSANGALLSIEDYTKEFIQLHQSGNSEQDLAEKLGITRKSLWEKRKKWGIKRPSNN